MPLAKPAHKTVCPVASTPNQPIPMAVFGLRFRPAYCRGRRASQAARHQIGLLMPAPNIRSARVWGASDYRPVHFPCFRGEASPVETHASGRWVFSPRTPSKNRVPQRQGSFSRLAMRKKKNSELADHNTATYTSQWSVPSPRLVVPKGWGSTHSHKNILFQLTRKLLVGNT